MDSLGEEWKKTGVWICTKCFKNSSIAEDLKGEFKTKLKDVGLSKQIRVMTSSCLGVCPEKKQAVYVQKLGSAPEVYAIDPDTESEKLFLSLTLSVKS
jgi:hypothetical protein